MADVRTYAGVPTAAEFADMGAPFPGGTPIVINSLTGDAYVLIGGLVVGISGGNLATGCAFFAYNSVTDTNQTGNGGVAAIDFNTEVYDVGSNFASDTFTAPATGKYFLTTTVLINSIDTATADAAQVNLLTTARNYRSVFNLTNSMPDALSLTITVLADMLITETASVNAVVTGMGADTAGILGSSASMLTYFMGYRVA